MPVGSVEIALPAGGDFSLLPNGDLALVQDLPQQPSPAATTQRLIRLILSNARTFDQTTGIITMPDDIFNTGWGANTRSSVGAPIDSNLLALLTGQIVRALTADPDVANIPAPAVTSIAQTGVNMVTVTIECTALTGELITIPSLQIPIMGA